jgi:hypothetical protein
MFNRFIGGPPDSLSPSQNHHLPRVIAGFVAISITSGGGAWDNAKKYIEDGDYGGKGSDATRRRSPATPSAIPTGIWRAPPSTR